MYVFTNVMTMSDMIILSLLAQYTLQHYQILLSNKKSVAWFMP